MPHESVEQNPEDLSPLRRYRERHDLTQQEVADRLKVSRSLVGKWEKGDKRMTVEMILLVERELGIDRDELLPKRPAREALAVGA